MRYPEAPREDIVDDLHGHKVADPYRWLEDPDSIETITWSKSQDELSSSILESLPGREFLRRRLRELTPGQITPPSWRGDRAFLYKREPGAEHAALVVREPDGSERVLIDPSALSDDDTVTLDGVSVSKEGERVAYLLSESGDEMQSLYVMSVDTGQNIEGPIDIGRGGALAWLPGGEELFVVRRLPDLGPEDAQFHRRVWRHRIGTDSSHDSVLFGDGRDKTTYYSVTTSHDGRWLTVSGSLGTAPRNDVYLFDLTQPDAAPAVIQEGVDALTGAAVESDGRLYVFTNRGASKWKLLVGDPTKPADLTELVAESDAVFSHFTLTNDALVAVYSRDATSEVVLLDKATGARRGEIELPGLGVASVSSRPEGGDEVWIYYSDFVTPGTILHHEVSTGTTTEWAIAPGTPELPELHSERVFVTSKDGTQVPMFIVGPKGRSGPLPTTLGGYGGFNVTQSPGYSPAVVAWVEAGGVFAQACLRGGGEYGEQWHRDGMRDKKQNVFDDFVACADWLVESGVTTRENLSISGGSNGGLLVGAALTQRPDLCAAVVCSAPLLDMVRYERFGLGVTWNDEYGTADDGEQLGWLLSYSPYHRVVEGTQYPAVLFTTFASDTRVDPLHARKLCAALQHATIGDFETRPILLRFEHKVGHGARSTSRAADLAADSLAFRARFTGLALPA
jgi:prolyl oligopeptidase